MLAAVVVGIGVAGGANAITISLTTTTPTVGVGATVAVDLRVSGLGAAGAPSIGSFEIDVSFGTSVLSFDVGSILFGSSLGTPICSIPSTPGCKALLASSTSPGLIELGYSSLDLASLNGLQADTFVLASFSFTAAGVGPTTLGFPQLVAGDETGTPFGSIGFSNLTILVTPEPQIWALLAAGGLLTLRRRRH